MKVRGNLEPGETNVTKGEKDKKTKGNLEPGEDGPAGDERPGQAGEPREVGGEELPH